MDYEKNVIWLKINRNISFTIFGLYYEMFKNICYYRETDITYDIFKKTLIKLFNDYIDSLKDFDNNEQILNNYEELMNNFLEYFSFFCEDEESREIALNYKKDVINMDTEFPWISIINKLELSYDDKGDLLILVSDYLSNVYGYLNGYYSEEDRDKVFSLIVDSVFNYIANINSINFDKDNYIENFLLNNKKCVNEIIDKNIFDVSNINVLENEECYNLISSLSEKELKLFIHNLKLSLVTGGYSPNLVYSTKELLEDTHMSGIKYSLLNKNIYNKMNKYLSGLPDKVVTNKKLSKQKNK